MRDKENMDDFVRAKLGIGLPPRREERSTIAERTLTDDLDSISLEGELIKTEKSEKDASYVESVLRDMDEDLESLLSCIDDYRGLLKSQIKK